MLYIQESNGVYLPAAKEQVFHEANRLAGYQLRRGSALTTPCLAKEAIAIRLLRKDREVVSCLFLDNQNRVIEYQEMFHGTINTAKVHLRQILKEVVRLNAAALIIAHNHPSGICDISAADISITKELVKLMKLIDVRVLDHIIVGSEMVSMMELGKMPKAA